MTLQSAPAAATCCAPGCCTDNSSNPANLSEPLAVADPESSIKDAVRTKYAQAATGSGGCCGEELTMIGDAYDGVVGHEPEADLGLGCGLPTEHAGLRPGQTVLDLGSGAGIDAFVARSIVGEGGRVFGLDFTPEMNAKARANAAKLGYTNVHFLDGDIEQIPLPDSSVDIVISNCVLNLVPDKVQAFAEIRRVLRPGGHFCVSDIVTRGVLPETVQRDVELYVGCVAGALERSAYLELIHEAGFARVEVATEREIDVPDVFLHAALPADEVADLRVCDVAVLSVTVVGYLDAA